MNSLTLPKRDGLVSGIYGDDFGASAENEW